MDKFTKYLLLGVMLTAFLALMWTSWELNRTVKNINQTIEEIDKVEKRIKALEEELVISMGMSSGYHIPMYYTEAWAVAIGGGPDRYVTEIVME